MKKILFIIIYLFIIVNSVLSQYLINEFWYNSFEKNYYLSKNNNYTSIKPFSLLQYQNFYDSAYSKYAENPKNIIPNLLISTLKINDDKIVFYLSPLVCIKNEYNLNKNKNYIETTSGLRFTGTYSKKIDFIFEYQANNSSYPTYIDSLMKISKVQPGFGNAIKTDLGYYSSDLRWRVSYYPSKYLKFCAGKNKIFIGDGYRSMLFSENSNSFLFFKISAELSFINYDILYADLGKTENNIGNKTKINNKYGIFHYLTFNICKKSSLSFFESIIWQKKDSLWNRGFDINYLNPVVFFRPTEFSLGSPDNTLLGVNFKYNISKSIIFYNQILLDDFILNEYKADVKHFLKPNDKSIDYGYWTTKTAYQIGFRFYDIFSLKNLSLQTEFNSARPYTYSHRKVEQNYGSYNQALAHPLGANFYELNNILRFNYKKIFIRLQYTWSKCGIDSINSHFGQNIYKPTYDAYENITNNIPVKVYGNTTAQGIKSVLNYVDIRTIYLINYLSQFNIFGGFNIHNNKCSFYEKNNYSVYLGISTNLNYKYFDY